MSLETGLLPHTHPQAPGMLTLSISLPQYLVVLYDHM